MIGLAYTFNWHRHSTVTQSGIKALLFRWHHLYMSLRYRDRKHVSLPKRRKAIYVCVLLYVLMLCFCFNSPTRWNMPDGTFTKYVFFFLNLVMSPTFGKGSFFFPVIGVIGGSFSQPHSKQANQILFKPSNFIVHHTVSLPEKKLVIVLEKVWGFLMCLHFCNSHREGDNYCYYLFYFL